MAQQSITFSFTVNVAELLIFHPPPQLFVGQAVSFQIFSGGTPPYTYTNETGTLPAGLTLGTDGFLKGTPTTAGSATITGTCADSAT